MPDAIIFDFDGTIADTLTQARLVLNGMAEDYNFAPISEDQVSSLQGMTVDQLTKHIGVKRRHVPILLAKGTRTLRSHIQEIPLCNGMAEILPQLRSQAQHFGILTSNSVENVELFLNRHKLRHLFTFISSTSKLKGKAKYLKSIARTFSLETKNMLYIGDEVRDIRAAKKANTPAIAVTWGFNNSQALEAEAPKHLVNTASELLGAVQV